MSLHTDTVAETESQAMRRLLAKARDEGVKLGVDSLGRYWATSISQPDRRHAVTGFSCDCKGFAGHQRCKHLAALHAHLGWLTDTEPTPPAPITAPVIELRHVEGGYQPGGWLVAVDQLVWRETITSLFVDGMLYVTITGDYSPKVIALPGTEAEADFSDQAKGQKHYDTAVEWVKAIDRNAPIHELTQAVDLWRADEFIESEAELAAA